MDLVALVNYLEFLVDFVQSPDNALGAYEGRRSFDYVLGNYALNSLVVSAAAVYLITNSGLPLKGSSISSASA